MRKGEGLAFVCVLVLLIALSLASAATPSAGQESRGTIHAVKAATVPYAGGEVHFTLTITNNGSIPISDIQVYEYFNKAFVTNGSISITEPAASITELVSASGVATAAQAIITPPMPDTLQPGQQLIIRYDSYSPDSGDFQVPAALVWYSYGFGGTLITTSMYSNGLLIHIPGFVEKEAFLIYPYAISASAFTSTFGVLIWARQRLRRLRNRY